MLQADYERLPAFPIPVHVSMGAERLKLRGGTVRLYRFDDGSIGLWWPSIDRCHEALMQIIQDRAVWNRMGKHWYIEAGDANAVLRNFEPLAAEQPHR
ncbi:hypothetical protein [Aureimonas jatrophae]|uniref:Uncharacterized protein n=1 Tax=Aureimonas jatrophae TaxID=1166073 RepID=A0A1H0N0U0_9HYPH|nr:hypothetical protein [Aureimonas jatrophae]MBB3952992.1 hypothetical protein [Aureimonas jatrophae]SDO86349.1 hypothetical protein SAMN05192530_11647 [Aureimonas jatrophae]